MDTLKLTNPVLFLSTLSLRRATTRKSYRRIRPERFLSTLSLRRATQIKQTCRVEISISIHALLAESDRGRLFSFYTQQRFLSTLSLRRATGQLPTTQPPTMHFYPRSPCGERLAYPDMIICTNVISIHALLAESDSLTDRRH